MMKMKSCTKCSRMPRQQSNRQTWRDTLRSSTGLKTISTLATDIGTRRLWQEISSNRKKLACYHSQVTLIRLA